MIIRSQDKRKIETFERAFVDDGCRTVYVNCLNMGVYSAEEKAIKVLDMICETYQKCEDCKSGLRKIADTYFVFQMPQDFEV